MPTLRTKTLVSMLVATTVLATTASATAMAAPPPGSHVAQLTAATSKTLTLGVTGIPPQIDTQVFTSGVESIASLAQVTAGLVAYKPLPAISKTLGGLSDVIPALASSFKSTPQGEVFTLRSAKAANGDVLTPADVQYTYQRDVATKDGVGGFLMSTAGINTANPVTILGPHTLRINGTLTPLAPLAYTFYDFSILDAKVVKAHATASDPWATKWLNTHTADFGAYTVTSFEANQRIAMTANPNYFGGAPKYTNLILTPYGGQSAAQLIRSGTVQFGFWVPNAQYKSLAADKSLKAVVEPSLSQDVLTVDPKFGPFADAKVRQAMSMAINRAALVAGPYQGIGVPSKGPVSSSIGATANVRSKYFTYNLAAAKRLMAQSSYPKGFTFTLAVNAQTVDSVDVTALAADLQSMLSSIGITMSVDNVADPSQFAAGQSARSYQAYVWSEAPITPDATYDLNLYYGPTGIENNAKIGDPTFDADVVKAAASPLGSVRDGYSVQAVKAWDQEMWAVPLVDTSYGYVSVKSVCGIAPSALQTVKIQTLTPCGS
jgi:peptide/nickel transport system substrate-binding protein